MLFAGDGDNGADPLANSMMALSDYGGGGEGKHPSSRHHHPFYR